MCRAGEGNVAAEWYWHIVSMRRDRRQHRHIINFNNSHSILHSWHVKINDILAAWSLTALGGRGSSNPVPFPFYYDLAFRALRRSWIKRERTHRNHTEYWIGEIRHHIFDHINWTKQWQIRNTTPIPSSLRREWLIWHYSFAWLILGGRRVRCGALSSLRP